MSDGPDTIKLKKLISDEVEEHIVADISKKSVRELVLQWWVADSAIVIALSAMLFTGLPIIGRVAWTEEVKQQRETDIQIAQEPLLRRMTAVEESTRLTREMVSDVVINSLASDICRYNVRRLKENDADERDRIIRMIRDLREKYEKYAGKEFKLSDC